MAAWIVWVREESASRLAKVAAGSASFTMLRVAARAFSAMHTRIDWYVATADDSLTIMLS